MQHAHNGVFGARRGADDARNQTDQKAGGCTDQGNEHRIADAGKQVAVILADDSEYFSDKFHLISPVPFKILRSYFLIMTTRLLL